MARWLRFFVSLGVVAGLVGLALPSQEAVAKTPSGEQADPEPLSLEDTVDLSVEDIQAFWKKQFPATFKGRRYEPIPASQIFPYDTTTGFPGCGDATPRPYIKNARYCPLDDTVAYDIEGLFPEQYNDFGNFAVAMILAHEWGHAIQERAYGLEHAEAAGIPSIVLETQADCFAGTWARRVNDKKSKTLLPEPGDLDAALAGLLSVADQVGRDASAPGAHGSAFDRIERVPDWFRRWHETVRRVRRQSARLLRGPVHRHRGPGHRWQPPRRHAHSARDQGPRRVLGDRAHRLPARLGRDPVRRGPPEREPAADVRRRTARPRELRGHDLLLRGRRLRCVGQPAALDGGGELRRLRRGHAHRDQLVRRRAHRVKSKTKGKARTLEADCLTGSWVGSLVEQIREPELSLSPGDLDEAMQALLKYERSLDKKLSAFDRAGSFRKGFEDGASACVKTGKSGG